jgi:hypothetical protein
MVSRLGERAAVSGLRRCRASPVVEGSVASRGLRWSSAPRVWTTQKKKKRAGKRRRSRRRKREKERRYAGGFVDAAVACARGDILLICLNYYCCNYRGTSSG